MEMMYDIASLLVLFVAAYLLSKALWRAYILRTAKDPTSRFSHLPIPPGDYGIPIIGETLTWAIQGSRFNIIRRQKYGKIFSSNYIGKTMVKVTGSEYVKQILTASHRDVSTIWPTSVRRVVGETSISNSVGALHKYRRKVFLKAFTHAALNSYIPQVHRVVKDRMKRWLNTTETPLIYHGTKEMTFEVAFRVLVGLSFQNNAERKELFETFDTMITNLFSLPYEFPGSGFSKALKARKVIHGLLDSHLKKKREKVQKKIAEGEFAAESSDESLKNALYYILEALFMQQTSAQNSESDAVTDKTPNGNCATEEENHVLSDVELKETTVEMLFAGYQTVASSGTSAVLNLIQHPEVFQKLEDELRRFNLLEQKCGQNDANDNVICEAESRSQEVAESLGNNNKDFDCYSKVDLACDELAEGVETPVTLELLSQMQYLEQVMRETLRVAPPILGGYRKAQRTFQLGKYRVPKGWTIIYNITDTHESEWSEDKEFNPDRFSPENWKDSRESRFRWIAFGGGPRICVGKDFARLQFKLFLIELVRTFRKIEFAKDKPPKMFAIPFLHPTDGLPVRFTPRERKSASENKKAK